MTNEEWERRIRALLARIPTVPLEQCAKADYLICGPERCFPDDVRTVCAMCSRVIFHRPYQPAGPVRICMPCMMTLEREH